jgi:hypothetical protein
MTNNQKLYNKERHLEILELEENSQVLTQEQKTELLNYACRLEDYIFWIDRHHYVILLNNFNLELMKCEEFQFAYYQLWYQSMKHISSIDKNRTELRNIQISNSKNSFEFSRLITAILRSFDELSDEQISDEEFKEYLQTSTRKIKRNYKI